jgi:hypothetical protein
MNCDVLLMSATPKKNNEKIWQSLIHIFKIYR